MVGDEYGGSFKTLSQPFLRNSKTFLHFEDFGRNNARRLLDRYRNEYCVFNDDVQGTGLIALATIKSASLLINKRYQDHKIVILGPGTAGIGVADALVEAMVQLGVERKKACKSIWLVGRRGILHEGMTEVFGDQQKYLRENKEISNWSDYSLLSTIEHVKPTVLIGCSGVNGAFTESCEEHASFLPSTNHHAII